MTRRLAAGLAVAVLAVLAGCATRRSAAFVPAGAVEAARALEAWSRALRRADELPSAKLLYDASAASGIFRISGTLAVEEAPGRVEAVLTGPFGSPIARYEDGALRGDRVRPITVAPEELRSLLAGVWRAGTPSIAGLRGTEALLRWPKENGSAEAILDLPSARLTQLTISRREGELTARYSGAPNPWPEKIELEDTKTGHRLELSLVGKEPM